jgi:pyruvate,orthophosphate dikinase
MLRPAVTFNPFVSSRHFKATVMAKYVYFFGPQGTDGDASMKNSLGGKGANLAEMAKPRPARARRLHHQHRVLHRLSEGGRKFPESSLKKRSSRPEEDRSRDGHEVRRPEDPLLDQSCRSGARKSMPGMMETVLNVGLCSRDDPRPDQEDQATSGSSTTPTAG